MLFKWVVVLYNWLLRAKPRVAIALADEEGNHQIIVKRFKTKSLPKQDDLMFFQEEGPYFLVDRVLHNVGLRHSIWIILKPFTDSKLEIKDEKNEK